jgi:hypothetical protein
VAQTARHTRTISDLNQNSKPSNIEYFLRVDHPRVLNF